MTTARQKYLVKDLKEGMFVSDLDRPWHQTPFPLQGFYIRSDDDVKALEDYCTHVYIDVKKASSKLQVSPHAPAARKSAKQRRTSIERLARPKGDEETKLSLPPIKIKSPKHYEKSASIKGEMARAEKLYDAVYHAIENVYASVDAGVAVSLEETEAVADSMVASVVRNPDALVWLAKVNEADSHIYKHSVNSAIWALVLGRHLGLDEVTLRNLASGVLLANVGKAQLPESCFKDEQELDETALQQYQGYVANSVQMLRQGDTVNEAVVAVVQYHRERHNGTGFPQGVTGERIPLIAKIAGLVDYYQRKTCTRNKQNALSPVAAVSDLYAQRNILFQEDIVEKFIEAVGVYPTGTLVTLNNQEVAIVMGHNEERRLLPKVMVVMDADHKPLKAGRIVDLREHNQHRAANELLQISDSLPAGAHDIDASDYLITGAKSRWSWCHIKGSLSAH